MCYRARVTLGHDVVVHTRPAAWVAYPLKDLDATVQFHRDGCSCNIRTELALVDVMQAAADLKLESNTVFELTCEGADAHAAYEGLRESLTSNYFEGSEFVPLTESGEATDG